GPSNQPIPPTYNIPPQIQPPYNHLHPTQSATLPVISNTPGVSISRSASPDVERLRPHEQALGLDAYTPPVEYTTPLKQYYPQPPSGYASRSSSPQPPQQPPTFVSPIGSPQYNLLPTQGRYSLQAQQTYTARPAPQQFQQRPPQQVY